MSHPKKDKNLKELNRKTQTALNFYVKVNPPTHPENRATNYTGQELKIPIRV